MKILFQGDSITDAFRKPEEINPAFQLGNGYAFLIAARLAMDHPNRPYQFINRGISGNAVQDLLARWQRDALDLSPDLLSLLIGVNDVGRRFQSKASMPDEEVLSGYRQLLEQMRGNNARLRLILLEPYLLEAGEVTRERIAAIKPLQHGIAKMAAEFGAIYIPLQKLMDDALRRAPAAFWAYDGVHATHAGFQLIADAWLDAAKAQNYV